MRDLASQRAEVRSEAATELARHADVDRDAVVAALRRSLDDDDPGVRAAAALALADIKAEEALDALIATADDPDEHVQQMVVAALGEIGSARALPAVEAALASAAPSVRFQAVMAHPRVSDDRGRAVEMLVGATRDRDPLVRHIALRMAEEMGGDEHPVPAPMLARAEALLDDDEHVVAVAAAVILGRAGLDKGAAVLRQVASREIITREADDEAAAIELCGELGLREAIPALERRGFERVLLIQHDPFAWQARVALARLGHARAIAWVLSELDAWNRERRCLAVAAARMAKVSQARPLLEAMRGDARRADPDEVEDALAALDGT